MNFLILLILLCLCFGSILGEDEHPNIIFLMCDSMDGRILDPTSDVSARVEMPNLRKLASRGVNFINTYAESPQCAPSRTTMFTGRHIHKIKSYNNAIPLTGVPGSDQLDSTCVSTYGKDICTYIWDRQKNDTPATLVDTLRSVNYEPSLYGKVDVGANVIHDPKEPHATAPGLHTNRLDIFARTANIRLPTKGNPMNDLSDKDNNVHAEDWKMVQHCIEYLHNKAAVRDGKKQSNDDDTDNWMLYCSVNIPHPAFKTNATWLEYVNDAKVNVPVWKDKADFHPADS